MKNDKCVICTIGTSIANGCELQSKYFKPGHAWDDDTKDFEQQINKRVSEFEQDIQKVSAEINSLERIGLTRSSKVVLLATDNAASKACANELKKLITQHFSLDDKNVEIRRIKGLQVHNAKLLKEQGFRELVKTVLAYLTDDNLNYQYDVILNPTGGYKGVIPFLTVLGMLYGKPSVYIFEHAEQLISLPPLPVTFDIDIYSRVVPALKRIDEQTAISEQEYYSCIIDYTEAEKPLFSSFIEPIDNNMVTISPLAEVLLSIENRSETPMVSQTVIDELQHDKTQPALALKRLIKNSVNPLWRKQHSEKWHQTDLIVIKQNATAERLAGFIKDNIFHVAYAFRTHESYELELPKYDEQSAKKLSYMPWSITENVGQAQSNNYSELVKERDLLLIENEQLKGEAEALEEKIVNLDIVHLEKRELAHNTQKELQDVKQQLAHSENELEQIKMQAKTTEQQLEKQRLKRKQLEKQVYEQQQAVSKMKSKPFWAKFLNIIKK